MASYSGSIDFTNRPSINLVWSIETTNDSANSRTKVAISMVATPDAKNTWGPYGTGNHSVKCAKATNPDSSGTWSLDFRSPNLETPKTIVSTTRYINYGNGTTATITLAADGGGSTLGSATTGSKTIAIFNAPDVAKPEAFSATPYTGGTVNTDYSDYVASVGATNITVTSGSLPAGLSGAFATNAKNSGNPGFVVTGTPTTAGTSSFTLTATNTGGSTTYAASITIAAQKFSVTYAGNNNDGGSVPTDSTEYSVNDTVTVKGPGTLSKTGFTFSGWSSGGSTYYAQDTFSISSNRTLTAIWQSSVITPVFSDSTVVSPATIGVLYSDAVAASNAQSYSIFSGALPPGISLNTTNGALSGTPTTQGTYSFVVRATSSSGGLANTGTITMLVYPAGFRLTGSSTKTRLTTAKRFIGIGQTTTNAQGETLTADASGYVNLSRMMVFKSGVWTNISNVS